MKLTKYGHACMVLEEQGKKLVIDPGELTDNFGGVDDIVGVVVTHEHADHFNAKHLDTILNANPGAKIYAAEEAAAAYGHDAVAPKAGQEETVGPFRLRFSGDMHAVIHPDFPRPHNIAVMVNDSFFYPGDSYTEPDTPVRLLALPANAPWMKAADSMDYLTKIKPQQSIPTHNGLLSDAGNMVYNHWLQQAADRLGATFTYLRPGESVEFY